VVSFNTLLQVLNSYKLIPLLSIFIYSNFRLLNYLQLFLFYVEGRHLGLIRDLLFKNDLARERCEIDVWASSVVLRLESDLTVGLHGCLDLTISCFILFGTLIL
jgi:hypothetical protein